MKYRKKPVVIDAYQTDKPMDIETLEGTMHANPGDYRCQAGRKRQGWQQNAIHYTYYENGNLTVSKKVTKGDKSKEFEFTVTLSGKTADGQESGKYRRFFGHRAYDGDFRSGCRWNFGDRGISQKNKPVR